MGRSRRLIRHYHELSADAVLERSSSAHPPHCSCKLSPCRCAAEGFEPLTSGVQSQGTLSLLFAVVQRYLQNSQFPSRVLHGCSRSFVWVGVLPVYLVAPRLTRRVATASHSQGSEASVSSHTADRGPGQRPDREARSGLLCWFKSPAKGGKIY